jgi:adenosylmethionine-8-amino-7-oxononanoate aminotransferase
LRGALDDAPAVGDVRGLGMMTGIELVRDRETKEPFARADQVTERVLAAARDDGLLLYSSTGHADGVNGDLIMLGPPFTLSDADATTLVERTAAAIRSVA